MVKKEETELWSITFWRKMMLYIGKFSEKKEETRLKMEEFSQKEEQLQAMHLDQNSSQPEMSFLVENETKNKEKGQKL